MSWFSHTWHWNGCWCLNSNYVYYLYWRHDSLNFDLIVRSSFIPLGITSIIVRMGWYRIIERTLIIRCSSFILFQCVTMLTDAMSSYLLAFLSLLLVQGVQIQIAKGVWFWSRVYIYDKGVIFFRHPIECCFNMMRI